MGPPVPGGHMGCRGCALAYMGQGHQPLEAHAPKGQEEGRVLKGEGTSEVPWGGWTPPPLGRTLPWRKGQGCALPFSLGPIYSGGREGSNIQALAPPSPSRDTSFSSPVVLGEALQDCHAPPPPPRRCAAAGWSLPQPLPLSLLDQGMGDVTGLYVC